MCSETGNLGGGVCLRRNTWAAITYVFFTKTEWFWRESRGLMVVFGIPDSAIQFVTSLALHPFFLNMADEPFQPMLQEKGLDHEFMWMQTPVKEMNSM